MWSYTLEKWDGQAALATGPCRLASDALFRTRPFSLPFEVVSSTVATYVLRVPIMRTFGGGVLWRQS